METTFIVFERISTQAVAVNILTANNIFENVRNFGQNNKKAQSEVLRAFCRLVL